MSDSSGNVAASYHLDAWGQYRFPTELNASPNRFGFTGYIYDRETDLHYAKARYYDSEFGRFTTQDSFLGRVDQPPTLHRYAYAHLNPARFIDPTGHCSVAATYQNFSDCFTAGVRGVVAPPTEFVLNWGSALLYNATGNERFYERGMAFQDQRDAVNRSLRSPQQMVTSIGQGMVDAAAEVQASIDDGRGSEAAEGMGTFLSEAAALRGSTPRVRVRGTPGMVTAEGLVLDGSASVAVRAGAPVPSGVLLSSNSNANDGDARVVEENTPSDSNPSLTRQEKVTGEGSGDAASVTPPPDTPGGPIEPYNRRRHYGSTPRRSDREAVGAGQGEVADHQPELVRRYYEGDPATGERPGHQMTDAERRASAQDRARMRPQPRDESNRQGAEAARYSREQKKKYFDDESKKEQE